MLSQLDIMCQSFEDELQKIAAAKNAAAAEAAKLLSKKNLAVAGAGALGFETLRRANQDRKTGRQLRIQQQY